MATAAEHSVESLDVRLNVVCGIAFFVFCMVTHHFASRRVCQKSFKTYSTLPWQLQMEWDSRIVSSIHALLVTILSIYSLSYEQPLWTGKIDQPTKIGGVTLAISAAYMLADAVSMPIYWRDTNLLVFWMHHGIAALCFGICATRGVLHFFALFRLVSELSTPFLNVNWFNRLCKVSIGSWLSLGNSLCLSASYLVCRIAVIPIYWFFVIQSLRTDAFRRLAAEGNTVTVIWIASSVVLDVLNLFWTKSILLGSIQRTRKGLRMRWLSKQED